MFVATVGFRAAKCRLPTEQNMKKKKKPTKTEKMGNECITIRTSDDKVWHTKTTPKYRITAPRYTG